MNLEAAAFWFFVIAVIGALIFARMGMLRDYLLAMLIVVVLLSLFLVIDNVVRSALHI